jgi:hypothetical protein
LVHESNAIRQMNIVVLYMLIFLVGCLNMFFLKSASLCVYLTDTNSFSI